ncbi:MAG TPA: hypothetical protein VND68_14300, partial [Chloroflexia bacterium]|nr:hypothetical protein [Chloroflexia bacterium]
MNRNTAGTRFGLPVVFLCLLCALAVSGCGNVPTGGEIDVPSPLPAAPIATPTVDLARAREAFQSGGELTYEEVLALRLDIVGDPEEADKYRDDFDKYYKAQE